MKSRYETNSEHVTSIHEQQIKSTGERRTPATPPVSAGNRYLILLSLVALYFIWGSTYLAMGIALKGFPPFLMASVRFLVAGGLLYPIMRLRGTPAPTRKQWIGAIVIGVLLLVGGNGGVAFAEQWVATGLAAVGLAAIPLWTALFAGLWGRWPTRLEWLGLAVGFAGVLMLNAGNGVWANPIGAVALLLAPIAWALGSAWSRYIALPGGLMSSAAQMLAGGAVLLVLSLSLREHAPNLAIGQSLWAIGFLIVFGSLIAFSAYGYLLRHVRPALATSYAYVNPMVAVGLGVLLNGEHLTPLEVVAIMITLVGVVLVSLGRKSS